MEGHVILLLFSAALFTLPSNSSAVDTIAAGHAIRDGETIVSAGEMYELGFFSPGKPKNRYLRVWYKKISTGTVVWVANQDTPLTNESGVLRVTDEGTLQLLNGNETLIWSSNSSNPSTPSSKPVARILDTGNVVVMNGNGNDQGSFLWQSFDYPTDTLLPGMKLGKDSITGIDRHLTSWKTPDDPSLGLYVMWVDTNGYPQIFQRQGSVLQLRIGPWNGLRFSGTRVDKTNTIYSVDFVFNENKTYFKYELSGSVVHRVQLKWDGNSMQLNWIERVQQWVIYGTADVDSCGRYGLCGPYGRCSINKLPPCSCMEGFEPRHSGEWDTADWLGGCRRRKASDCRDGDGFQRNSGVNFPDTRRSWYSRSMTLGECETSCRRKCNCTAYASLDISDGGGGCLMWFNELLDVRDEYDESQDLYVRRAASELAGHMQLGSKKKQTIYAVVLSISSVPLVLLGMAVAVNVRRRSRMRVHANWAHVVDNNCSSIEKADLDPLPSFTLYEVANATDYFSIDNKIGEGGFGPVYKGVLEEGQKVAVKRLSNTSEQGLDEFKNEVICIAKLQHRNLVRLLGYCVHGDEMILIYEYLANKSLDSFLFGLVSAPVGLPLTMYRPQRPGVSRGPC